MKLLGRGQDPEFWVGLKNKKQFESKLTDIDLWRPNLMKRLEEGSLKIADKFDRNRNAIIFRKVLDNI